MKFLYCSNLLITLFLDISFAKCINNNYYNKNKILSETGWKDLSIETNASSHLSLLSQGIFNEQLNNKYDKNYYYPASAGKGVEVFMFDNGFNFNLDEFSEIEANIEAFIGKDGVKNVSDKAKELGIEESILRKDYRDPEKQSIPDHGTLTSIAVAGKKFGVAKKANIHGFTLLAEDETENNGDDSLNNLMYHGLKYLEENNLIKPHKTILNFSVIEKISLKEFNGKEYRKTQALINKLSKKGVVIVAGAGNDFIEPYNEKGKDKYAIVPCAFDNVICVGGVGNINNPEFMNDEIDSSYYEIANYEFYAEHFNMTFKVPSNYGSHVDIYAPFLFHYHGDVLTTQDTSLYLNYNENDYETIDTYYGKTVKDIDVIVPGTSMSTPLVSGVIATLMSEFYPKRKFTTSSMLKYLTEIGEKDIIKGVPVGCPNVFINNGKNIILNSDIHSKVKEPDNIVSEIEIDVVDTDIFEESDSDSE